MGPVRVPREANADKEAGRKSSENPGRRQGRRCRPVLHLLVNNISTWVGCVGTPDQAAAALLTPYSSGLNCGSLLHSRRAHVFVWTNVTFAGQTRLSLDIDTRRDSGSCETSPRQASAPF